MKIDYEFYECHESRQSKIRSWVVLVALLWGFITLSAKESVDSIEPARPVTASYMLEAGSAHLADTYLTPLKYSGWKLGLAYERFQAMKFNPEGWVMRYWGELEVDHTENPARNATMWLADLNLSWAMMHRWRLDHEVSLYLGGLTGVNLGALYNDRNGNNPVAVKAAWTVDLTAMATWKYRLGRLPILLRYQATMPLTGVFFSPDYGELYYEIYLGDHNGLAHAAWPGNYFSLDNLLTADLQLGGTWLRLGYHCLWHSSRVNHITSRHITHAFTIGITGEFLSLNPRRPSPLRTIPAL
ncbi:MAG: DUF3316 domain-containing protein [Bacteroidales bacterium]|nr:DUF3316 domain-containing protein [Bacteroidales bacterium]